MLKRSLQHRWISSLVGDETFEVDRNTTKHRLATIDEDLEIKSGKFCPCPRCYDSCHHKANAKVMRSLD